MRQRFATVVGLLLCGCATQSPQMALAQAATPELLASCRQCPPEAELKAAAGTPEQLEFVQRVNALETLMSGHPLSAGNQVQLLLDGPQTHKAQLAAIGAARHHVHLITYIMTDDTLAHQYLEALAGAVRRGVLVRFMFDSVGSRTISEEFLQKLADAKINVRAYGPMNPLDGPLQGTDQWRTTRRHHRKLLVVDGRVAFTGGVNISDEYRKSSEGGKGSGSGSGSGSGGGSKKDSKPGSSVGWRDTHIRVEGPVVAQFQTLFFESWKEGGEKIAHSGRYWPAIKPKGHDFVRVVQQQGNDLPQLLTNPLLEMFRTRDPKKGAIYGSYLAAITSAKQRIWITQAYFIPNEELLGALKQAARRGVDVRVLVPRTSDIKLMVHASRNHYSPLLDAGAKIWEYGGPMLHAKTAVVDGVWSTVGSSNLDFRSFIHNDEANAIIVGASFAREMERMFLDDTQGAHPIVKAEWDKRSLLERMRQRLASLLKWWI